MVAALDTIVLGVDRPDLGLAKGQPGTVLLVHDDGALEVEFADADGRTVAQSVLRPEEVAGGALPTTSRFLVFRTSTGSYSWRFVGSDGRLLATGEPMRSKAECLRAIKLLARNVGAAPVLDQTAA
jgi:uncharacterized protein YegP (UPF0339 family)